MIDDTPVEPSESFYDDSNGSSFGVSASSFESKTLPTKAAAKKRPRRPPAKAASAATAPAPSASRTVDIGMTSISSSSKNLSSFKTSSKALDQKLTNSSLGAAPSDTAEAEVHDFGTSDAPVAEGKKHVRVRANIWGLKVERRSGVNRYGCPTWRFIVQDEVRITMWVVLLVAALVVLAFFIAQMVDGVTVLFVYNGYAHAVAATIAGIFSFLACVLTFLQVQAHRRHWVHPASQRHVVRILLMVPVYAISAWTSLAFVKLSAYLDFVRNCYEAYVIWSFMLLLTEYLGGHTGVASMMRVKLKQKWPMPMCCMPRVKPDSKFLWYLKYGALQYVILSPIISALTIMLAGIGAPAIPAGSEDEEDGSPSYVNGTYVGTWCTDAYCDGNFRYDRGYAYIVFLQNATQLLSLYTLAWLYILMKQELKPYKPVPKFVVVKAVVFFTFWQSVAISFAAKVKILTATTNFDVGKLEVGLQDFLVCLEMFIAAAVHKYTFGYETYVDGTFTILMEQRKGNAASIPSGARVRIVHETSEGKTIWEPARGRSDAYEDAEPQVLTLIVDEPDGVPPALFDDDQSNDIDITAGVDAEDSQSMASVSKPVDLEMTTQRPTGAELDHSEQGVDSLMDMVDDNDD